MELMPKKIEQYARDHSSPEDPVLQELAEVTYAKAPLPQMQTGHVEGSFLRLLVKATGARRVLEIGTYTGYSSLAMAMGLPEDGRVITLDIDPEVTGIAKEYWAKSSHGFKIDLRLGPALETLKDLKGPFDLVFIDADKENYLNYWEACLPKVRSGGLLVVDNVLWGGSGHQSSCYLPLPAPLPPKENCEHRWTQAGDPAGPHGNEHATHDEVNMEDKAK